MEQKYFRIPFASTGDVRSIPESKTADGSVNWTEGWTLDYEKDMDTDSNAKPVERDAMNGVMYAITSALRQYQTSAFPEFITAADNGGSAFSYSAGTVVRYRADNTKPFKNYVSLLEANTAIPGSDESKWQEFIFAEASEKETEAGKSGTLIITPRRLKKATEAIEEKLEETLKNTVDPFTVPIGGGMLWFLKVPPEGWLEANGQSFDGEANPKLLEVYPWGRVPDARGRFPRFWDHGAGVDPDSNRGIFSVQDSQNLAHEHELQLILEHRNGIPDELLIQASVPKSQAIYEVPEANKNDQAAFIARSDLTKARSSGGSESRPTNVAVMLIIKTDQAEAEPNDPAPTAIVVTPATAKLHAGQKLQLGATVLPAAVGGNYPVSWSVTDDSLGSISAAGEYTSVAGKGGTQTLIGSISTGLTATATVTQEIYVTSITIGAIPAELVADRSYDIAITYSPTDFTESIVATSSDSSIATLTPSGTLFVPGQGTATLALTGASSGITKSITVKTQAAVVTPVYLEIANNLSEIADAGKESQAMAQEHLGLGKLALIDELTAADIGAVPQSTAALAADVDLNDVTTAGEYFQNVTSRATVALNYPEAVAGAIRVVGTGVDEGACRQFYWPYNSDKEYRRCAFGSPLKFSAWTEH